MRMTTTDIDFDDRTALIVVDVQNDFADPDGGLFVEGGDGIVPTINDLVDRARDGGATVVYTQDWHPDTTPHFAKDGGMWPVHCVAGTWGAELHPDLLVDGPIVQKGTGGEDGYSGFSMRDVTTGEDQPTGLRALLDERNIARVVVVGLAQDVCVKATALDAVHFGLQTTVPLAATRAVNVEPGDGDRAVREMRAAGATVA